MSRRVKLLQRLLGPLGVQVRSLARPRTDPVSEFERRRLKQTLEQGVPAAEVSSLYWIPNPSGGYDHRLSFHFDPDEVPHAEADAWLADRLREVADLLEAEAHTDLQEDR